MTEKYYVLVAGTGETSRANVEALMEDHYYANGDNGTLVLAFDDAPTKSQTYVAQYAKDCNKDIVLFSHSGAVSAGIPSATAIGATNPVKEAVAWLKDQKATAFLLWEPSNTDILQECLDAGITAVDLCDGLVPLTSAPYPESVEAKKELVKKVEAVLQPTLPVVPRGASMSEIRARVKDALYNLQAVLDLIEGK